MSYLYKISNKTNDRFYIGVTSQDIENYWGSGLAIKSAVKKYGKDSFEKQILMTFDSIDDAYEAERLLVDEKMVSNELCYNITIGGNGGNLYDKSGENNPMFGTNGAFYGKKRPKHSKFMRGNENPMKKAENKNKFFKKVSQYDKDMNYIKDWDSTKEASETLNIQASDISKCCNNHIKSAGGYVWSFNKNN